MQEGEEIKEEDEDKDKLISFSFCFCFCFRFHFHFILLFPCLFPFSFLTTYVSIILFPVSFSFCNFHIFMFDLQMIISCFGRSEDHEDWLRDIEGELDVAKKALTTAESMLRRRPDQNSFYKK